MAKISISIDDDLLRRLDEYSDHTYNTRSGTITLALSNLLSTDELIRAISSMSYSMAKIAECGEIDDAMKEELRTLQRFAEMVYRPGKR